MTNVFHSRPCVLAYLSMRILNSKRQKFHTISLEKCLSLTPPVSCATAHPIRHLWPWQTEGRLHRQGYRCKHRRKHILTHNKTDMYVGASTDVKTWRHFQDRHGPKGFCVEMQIQTHRETYKDRPGYWMAAKMLCQ